MGRQARRFALRRQSLSKPHHHHQRSRSSSSTSSSSSSLSSFSVLHDLFSAKALKAIAAVDRVSGLKIPFAFLSSLRANLQISSSLEDLHSLSSTNTPDSLRPVTTMPNPSTDSLPQSSSPLATVEQEQEQPIPPLHTFLATTDDRKIAALHLIADSVAQQRQIAARYIIFRPETLAFAVLVLAFVTKLLYKGATSDLALVGTTWTGCVMAGLIAVRWATSGYIELAEKTGTWAWLNEGRGSNNNNNEDEVLVTTYGEEVIGALVMRVVSDGQDTIPPPTTTATGAPSRRHNRNSSSTTSTSSNRSSKRKSTPRTALIRAWTVKRRYRQREIGTGLLEEAVSMCRARDVNGPVFAERHANVGGVVPGWWRGVDVQREAWGRGVLERVKGRMG
ncbi:hypothetical protein FQN54_006257 [Arachnomyces sp. PD_36]|nr:hypothetical protein FQN54_006257 [Arachnomyces sp. PD_36]